MNNFFVLGVQHLVVSIWAQSFLTEKFDNQDAKKSGPKSVHPEPPELAHFQRSFGWFVEFQWGSGDTTKNRCKDEVAPTHRKHRHLEGLEGWKRNSCCRDSWGIASWEKGSSDFDAIDAIDACDILSPRYYAARPQQGFHLSTSEYFWRFSEHFWALWAQLDRWVERDGWIGAMHGLTRCILWLSNCQPVAKRNTAGKSNPST